MTTPLSPTPAPRATAEQAAALRADLEDSGWGVEAVAELLGPVADAALRREIRLPALLRVRAALEAGRAGTDGSATGSETGSAGTVGPAPGHATAVLTALFMLGEPVLASELEAALPRTGADGAAALGLVLPSPAEGEPDGRARVRAAVDLRPHEAADDAGEVRWWVASDLGELTTGRELAPDHVLGIGGAGLTLAALTPRTPVATALDLGCGCGIQTLYLLRHAERITATDISARALAFTAFNAALAGVEEGRLELLEGSFLEPLAGRRFDLVATNPPFVITPPAVREAGLPLMEYRDAGGPVLPTLVPGLGELLEPGGVVVMLGNWEHHVGQDWRERVTGWLPQGVDAWVVQRDIQDPVEYATMWLRDGGIAPERDPRAFEAALGAWVADFEARGVEAVGFGYLVLHRPGSPREPWRRLEEVSSQPSGALGPHVARTLALLDRLAAASDEDLAQQHPVVAPDVTIERHLLPGAAEPTLILARQGGGFGRTAQLTTAGAALVDVADGELSITQVAGAVAALMGADEGALRAELVATARELAVEGFVEL